MKAFASFSVERHFPPHLGQNPSVKRPQNWRSPSRSRAPRAGACGRNIHENHKKGWARSFWVLPSPLSSPWVSLEEQRAI